MEQKRILIAEDEPTLSKALYSKLQHEGIDVLLAYDGEEGLKMALEMKPDLILLDIIMPKMDGLTMLQRLRENPQGKDIAVITLTNLSDATSVQKSLENGAFEFLVKSNWKIEDIVGKVKKKLGEL